MVYKITRAAPLSSDQSLSNQMRRAAVSVASNIAEGFERDGSREFQQFLSLAKGSLGELRSQTYIGRDAGLIAAQQCDDLLRLTDEIARMTASLMHYLRGSEVAGRKRRRLSEHLSEYLFETPVQDT